MNKLKRWRRVRPSPKYGCRGGRDCGSIPRFERKTFRRNGDVSRSRYCVKHARKHGCKER